MSWSGASSHKGVIGGTGDDNLSHKWFAMFLGRKNSYNVSDHQSFDDINMSTHSHPLDLNSFASLRSETGNEALVLCACAA